VATLDAGLREGDFLLGDRYTVADVSLYAYAHVAHEAGVDTGPHRRLRDWLARVEATDGFVNDLAPYPENARAGSGGPSVHG
jgi:glutathione S-transferase